MENLQAIESKIIELTTLIETKYPELYKYLDENPITLDSENKEDISIKTMQDYLESLNQLLKHHIETHKNK